MDHSSLVGGSTADRRLGCNASWQEEQKVPAHIKNKSSSYADEGTGLHAAMQYIYENNIFEDMLEEHVLGREFEGILITEQLLETGIIPCMDYIDILMDEYADEGEFIFETETKCRMPGIDGAFGTSDFIFRTNKRSGIIDYKFGEGVPVKAFYIEEDKTKRPNSQLMFYARAAQETIPHMFENHLDWPVELHILQPRVRTGDGFSQHSVTVGGLEAFRLDLVDAIEKAQAKNPRHVKGPWCTFASCETVCPLYTGALLDTTKIAMLKKQDPTINFEQHLDMLLEMAHIAEEAITAIKAQAHAHLENGGNIVNAAGERTWKLVPKKAQEKTVDEPGMISFAKKAGLAEEKIFEPRAAKSPAQLGIALEPLMTVDADGKPLTTKKARTEEARRRLREFTTTASSGTNLAPFDDGRPEVTATPTLVAGYASKLAKLQQK